MANAFETLQERGFVKQNTHEAELLRLLSETTVTFYVGFDPTADSLHAGSLVPIMAMAHLQRAGHRPIAILGGGTTMVGDPSGKTEMRPLRSPQEIDANAAGILAQLQRYLDLSGEQGRFLNNAAWLTRLNYIDFLRDVGRYFRVNEMIKSEAYRQRLEREEGLSFIEFNYQLLQAYDFLVLSQRYGCRLQLGGDDQWGNILAGIELIRKTEGGSAYGLTFPLLTTVRGDKMGKTAGGTVWLSAARTSPFQFYQYWLNTDDLDVVRFLAYFTFLTMDEIRGLGRLQGSDIREAKEVLAYQVTMLAHGEEEAQAAREASRSAFGGSGFDLSALPSSTIRAERLVAGIPIISLLCEVKLTPSKSEAKRLIEQGGAYLNGKQIVDAEMAVTDQDVVSGSILLRFGKKLHHRVTIQGPGEGSPNE